MNCFFSHNFVETKRKFNYPFRGEVSNCLEEFLEKASFGFTVIEYKCSKCGKIETIEFIGDTQQD